MAQPPYLFVYGTLRSQAGNRWSRYLRETSVFIGMGRTRGLLFQVNGYPGLVAGTDSSEWVRGEVYLLSGSLTLPVLDAYEGCGEQDQPPYEFERKVLNIELDDGRTISAWAYVYCRETGGLKRITSGDYISPDFTPR